MGEEGGGRRTRLARPGLALATAVLVLASADPVQADEQFLAFTRGSETLPQGHWQLYQFVTLRTGKRSGSYYGFDFDTEVEYGITSRWQVNASIISHYFDYHDVDELGSKHAPDFGGVEASTKVNLLSPFMDPVGLALRLEGGYLIHDDVGGLDQDELYIAPEVDLQKNFLDDTLIYALDLGAEWAWGKKPAEQYWKELSLQAASGISYRFLPNWFVGAEAKIRSEYPRFHISDFEHAALYAGPSLHYSSRRWWVTVSWLYQAWGRGVGEKHDGQTYAEETEQVARVKVGFNF